MTQDEADKIAAVIRTADNGCPFCIQNLCDRLNRSGLGFVFERTDGQVTERNQPDWSDDPEDAFELEFPEVVARPPQRS